MADDILLKTCGGSFGRDVLGIHTIETTHEVPGPAEDGEDEPWELLSGYQPATPPMGLPEIARKASKRLDGSWDLTITFSGLPHGQEEVGIAEIDHAGAEEPVTVHQNYLAIAKRFKAYPLENGRFVGWTPTIKDPQTDKQIQNPMLGTDHYLRDTPVLRLSFASAKYINLLEGICTIDDPTTILPGAFKEISKPMGVATWLKRSVRITLRGNAWRYEIEWLHGLWAKEFYAPLAQQVLDMPVLKSPFALPGISVA